MDKIKLLKGLKKEHGTLSKFARRAGMDRYELQKFFSRGYSSVQDDKIIAKIDRNRAKLNARTFSDEIPPEKLEALKTKIKAYGGPHKFCRDNEFSRDSVFQILAGKRKGESPLAKRLFDFFGIK